MDARLLSSPPRRCLETLIPLAHRLGVDDIEPDDALALGAEPAELFTRLTDPGFDRAVRCNPRR